MITICFRMYIKDFDGWNGKKKQISSKSEEREAFVHDREVWWCSVGVNVGSEIDGKNENFERPVLVVRVISSQGFLGVPPLTSKEKKHRYEVKIAHDRGSSFANISQLRFFSRKRMLRKVGTVSEQYFRAVLNKLSDLFDRNFS